VQNEHSQVNLKAVPTMLAMIPSLFRGVQMRDLERIKAIAHKAYPAVPQLGTEKLSQWLQANPPPSMLLVDVRAPEEFAVSHLIGAINLREPGQIVRTATQQKAATVILYCSVGFRSSQLAHRVLRHGLGNVFNLDGSIFQWANEQRPIYQGAKLVEHVHPYRRRWAGLLKSGLASNC
jgi:rhodanese-related sulfurtransferase